MTTAEKVLRMLGRGNGNGVRPAHIASRAELRLTSQARRA